MADYPTLISYAEANEILHTLPLEPLGVQQVHFKNALYRICAQDLCAPYDVPAYPTAAMDGYAINFDDMPLLLTQGLQILPPNKAGNPMRPTLQRGYAIKTFTGSIMPINADTLIIVEHISLQEDRIFLSAPQEQVQKAKWIRQVGDNYKQGQVLLQKGDRIGAFEIGLLAELNQSFLLVYQKVRVGILCVGDEIIEVGQISPHHNVVRSVNAHLLESLLLQMGQEPIIYPLLKDDKQEIKNAYKKALNECDMIVSAGGMSMGDYDYTQEVIAELTNIAFKGVRLKPGKPVICAIYEDSNKKKPILGLPGFPNSCAITFLLFGSILLARLQNRIYQPSIFCATLCEDVKRSDSRLEFRACDVHQHNGTLQVSFSTKKSLQSSMINNLTHNAALAILEENGSNLKAGEQVKVMFLNHF